MTLTPASSRGLKKRCPGCGRQRAASFFGGNKGRPDGLQSQCKDCKRRSQARWYRENSKRHLQNVTRRRVGIRRENVARLVDYLRRHPCTDCGAADPLVLQFDHVRGSKVRDVALLLTQGYSWSAVEREMAKCEVRCANCHQRKTAREQGWHKASDR